MRRGSGRLLSVLTLLGMLLAGGMAAPVQAQASVVGCEVDYQVVADWGNGFQAAVTVTNTGEVPITWRVTIRYPGPIIVNPGQPGVQQLDRQTVIIVPPSWGGVLAPGASITVGFAAIGPSTPLSVEVECWPA